MARQHAWKPKRAEASMVRLLDAGKVITDLKDKRSKLSGLRPVVEKSPAETGF